MTFFQELRRRNVFRVGIAYVLAAWVLLKGVGLASSRDMVFSVRQLIAFISSVMTLLPGDLIYTGTPAGVGPLLPGDVVEVQIEGIGILSNPVIAEPVR